mmetsp:Transcript_30152/g.65251  ORF Transcript_30152/g.65251 Transcript_30152/m.65251 type:complete len:100 (-) Transcript_30152:706-1005(-)
MACPSRIAIRIGVASAFVIDTTRTMTRATIWAVGSHRGHEGSKKEDDLHGSGNGYWRRVGREVMGLYCTRDCGGLLPAFFFYSWVSISLLASSRPAGDE